MSKVELGSTVTDVVTGFSGIVIGITQWLTGCDSITVQPKIDKDGNVRESRVFDINRLQVSLDNRIVLSNDQERGGPHMLSEIQVQKRI